jgi:hypothetical protein
MAFTRAADGVASKGKTKGKNLGDSGPMQKEMMGGKGAGKGKTNANMKAMGRNLAKIAAQKRG